MSAQSVLVLGATGFIGRRIIAALTATSWARPIAASRRVAAGTFPDGVATLAVDATDEDALRRAITGADAVISCLAGSGATILRGGTALLASATQAAGQPRVIYLSSMAAYGSARGTVDETAPLRADLGEYSHAKAAIDQLAASYPNAVRLRPGIVYGSGSPWWSDRIARLLVQHRLGDLGVAGEGFCNLVHVDDVAAAAVRAIECPQAAGQAINLANPDVPTWNQFFGRYAQALGAAPLRRIGPARLWTELKVLGPALKVAGIGLGRNNPWRGYEAIRPWLTQLCRHDIRLDGRKAGRVLGLEYRSLQSGLAETAAWFLAGGRS